MEEEARMRKLREEQEAAERERLRKLEEERRRREREEEEREQKFDGHLVQTKRRMDFNSIISKHKFQI